MMQTGRDTPVAIHDTRPYTPGVDPTLTYLVITRVNLALFVIL
jgi:hypothetical protein